MFCNARSKSEHLDTVYSYSGVSTQANGSVFNLAGVQYVLARDGYRLPTESEWEFAGRGGTSLLPFSTIIDTLLALTSAWYSGNSSGKTHQVAMLQPNELGLYDLAGNVMEWTNDWKGFYTGTKISNSIGAQDPDDEFEKVMKGGAFDYAYAYLRPSMRSASYPTTLSTAVEYVGFRCARGPIPSEMYLNADTALVATNPTNLLAIDPVATFNSLAAKIVFVNVTGSTRTICYVDFSSSHPFVQEVACPENIYSPVISPDGRFVAYCTIGVGMSGPSKIMIRSLDSLRNNPVALPCDSGFIPRWWIDPGTSDTMLLYTNSAIPNSQPQWNTTVTCAQTIQNGKPVGAPVTLIQNGGFHDGRSPDGRYLFTGYTELLMYDFHTGLTSQLFVYPHNGKDAGGSNQVCNVSVTSDTTSNGQCMFLDFGSSGTSTITGTTYGIHQILFIADSSDSIRSWYPCPSGESGWDFPQWSNECRYAIASARNASENANSIYLIDLQQKSYSPIVTGTELEQPSVWIASNGGISAGVLDSLGSYDDPSVQGNQTGFASRIHYFWEVYDSIRIAFVGSSHSAYAIDPPSFQHHGVFNLGYFQCDPAGARSMINHYILVHCSNVKLIGMDLIMGFYNLPNQMSFNFQPGVGTSKGYVYDSMHGFWSSGFNSLIQTTLINHPFTPVPYMDSLNEEVPQPSTGWGGPDPSMYGAGGWDTSLAEYKQNLADLDSLIVELNERGIYFLLFITPENPAFAVNGFAGRYGPSLSVGEVIASQIQQLQAVYPNFHFYDADRFGQHDYADSEALNPDHLNHLGGQKLSRRLDSVISTFMPN